MVEPVEKIHSRDIFVKLIRLCDVTFTHVLNVYEHARWPTFQFHEKLYFYFLQKTRSEEVSEELVQLTYIKLWQYRQNLNTQFPISQQLFRIAKTTLIDILRKKASNRL